jgi:5-methylcytosine-specific restriction endonuclease McrA
VNAEVSFLFAVRILWSLVPERLFTSINPDFEKYAEDALREKFKDYGKESLPRLATVFRRLWAARKGRATTSLNLGQRSHQTLLRKQGRMCAVCRYQFTAEDEFYALDDDDEVYVTHHTPMPGEIVLSKYYRRPVLDHIIPHFLGGDRQENWQILCQSCNLGKGESLSWIARRGWMPSNRVGDLFTLSSGLRYAILADYLSTKTDDKTNEIRIFRCDESHLICYDNLKASTGC